MAIWSQFVTTWNSTIKRQPQLVLSSFLASQSLSWLGLFLTYSAFPIGVLPPELAVGMMVSKLTKKFRQPVNLALSAGIVGVAPRIAELKITPLLTGFVSDKETSEDLAAKRANLEARHPYMKSGISKAVDAANWLQGPVDKYGLALYLSGRATGVATVLGVTVLAQQGVDIPALLASYGLEGSAVSASVASLAAASVTNSLFSPVHFACCLWHQCCRESPPKLLVPTLDELKQRSALLQSDPDGEFSEDEAREKMRQTIVAGTSMVLIGTSLVTSLYAMKVMGGAGVDSYNAMSPDSSSADQIK